MIKLVKQLFLIGSFVSVSVFASNEIDYESSIATAFLKTFKLSENEYGMSPEPEKRTLFINDPKNPEKSIIECNLGWNYELDGEGTRLVGISVRICDSAKVLAEIEKLKADVEYKKLSLSTSFGGYHASKKGEFTEHTFPMVMVGHGAMVTRFYVLTGPKNSIVTTSYFFKEKSNYSKAMDLLANHEEELIPKFNEKVLNMVQSHQ